MHGTNAKEWKIKALKTEGHNVKFVHHNIILQECITMVDMWKGLSMGRLSTKESSQSDAEV